MVITALRFFVFLAAVIVTSGWTELKSKYSPGLGLDPGPLVRATSGQVWPKPQMQTFSTEFLLIDPKNFNIQVAGKTCDIVTDAVGRCMAALQTLRKLVRRRYRNSYKGRVKANLGSLKVNLTVDCQMRPYLYMNEQYSLRIRNSDSELVSSSVWGIVRGLETFSQLVYPLDDSAKLAINLTEILDFPRFPHRGLHLDSARHFMPMRIIFAMLDGMAMNKMNVFHWHLVDDQSFPYESKKWPELSAKGAYSPAHTYSPQNVADVIEYARLRGIRVVPEFDTPGHTRSWGEAYPELLVPCFDFSGKADGSYGPMNPISNFTYEFMSGFIQELTEVFPDGSLHLGGDEVPFDCWLSNPEIWQYMMNKGITSEALEGEYITKIIAMANSKNVTPIVWQEVFDNGISLPSNAVIHVWKDWINYREEMANVTRAGFNAIFSSCWYLDHLNTGGDWRKFYECDPDDFAADSAAHERVLGGEACMWAEVADATNVLTRVWPRASAVAERLWSAPSLSPDDTDSAANRLEEHACRMNLRGIPAQPPNGPGFCPLQLFT